jgi:hypothetical protein
MITWDATSKDGIIDAGSAGSALLGLDEALRFFNSQQSPQLTSLEYDIPVQTRPGSWEAIVLGGMAAVSGAFALGYAKKAGEKIAENDFKEISLTAALRKSMGALKTLAKIVKHTRQSKGWETARFSMDGKTPEVAILNGQNQELFVPIEYLRWYQSMPPRLLLRMTSVVRAHRVLHIGMSGDSESEEVVVGERDKTLFDEESEEDHDNEVLFPELMHGKKIVLEGRLVRGNETSNAIGLEYMGHILNCVPAAGNVRKYKSALFLRCRVSGVVNRHAKSRFVAERRPTLVIERVTALEKDKQQKLFDA